MENYTKTKVSYPICLLFSKIRKYVFDKTRDFYLWRSQNEAEEVMAPQNKLAKSFAGAYTISNC